MIALVGNKLDLAADRQVSREEGEAYASEAGLLFGEASARTGDRVSDVFVNIAKRLPKTEQQLASPRLAPDTRRIDLGRTPPEGQAAVSRCC